LNFGFNLGFLQIIVFFATYLGVVQNQNMKRFREIQRAASGALGYSSHRARLADAHVSRHRRVLGPPGGAGLQAEIIFFNSVFLFTYISCLVGSVSSTFGKETKLPLIGDAADMQQAPLECIRICIE
jgi:hypothetical protein